MKFDLWSHFLKDKGLMILLDFIDVFGSITFKDLEPVKNLKFALFYFMEMVLVSGEKRQLIKKDSMTYIQDDVICDKYS